MSATGFAQLALLLAALAATVPAMGRYLALVYGARPDGSAPGDRVFGPVERFVYRLMRVDERREQRWNVYALSLLAFSLWSFLAVYLLQRLQGVLPLNPTDAPAVAPAGAFNVAVSFVTNTNWQWYAGEVAMSHLTQMLALTVQNVVSAAAGMAVAIAVVRGIARRNAATLGSFWVDLVRTIVRFLLPIAFVGAVALAGLGVVQNLNGTTTVQTLDATAQQVQDLPGGMVASQESIKQLGSNGGGPYNANSSHPFENPNGWTNLLETYMILAVPLAMVVAYGHLVGSRRQARVLMAVMVVIWIAVSTVTIFAEQQGNPELTAAGADQSLSVEQSGGNMEGKDVRFGPASCGLWAGATTGTSNGSINCQHDSLTPAGGGLVMLQIMLGEVSPGGVGVGLMGILVYALIAVFIAGLMVGRTPEYLGKKIQAAEIKLVTLSLITMPLALLGFAAAAVLIPTARDAMANPGAHGLSEVLYAYASASNNNGSAFAGLSAGSDWFTITQGVAMLAGRFLLIIPALAVGGSLARKQRVPVTAGTMPTDTPLFAGLVLGVVAIVAGLTFFPALALGPIVEHLSL